MFVIVLVKRAGEIRKGMMSRPGGQDGRRERVKQEGGRLVEIWSVTLDYSLRCMWTACSVERKRKAGNESGKMGRDTKSLGADRRGLSLGDVKSDRKMTRFGSRGDAGDWRSCKGGN